MLVVDGGGEEVEQGEVVELRSARTLEGGKFCHYCEQDQMDSTRCESLMILILSLQSMLSIQPLLHAIRA